MGEVNSTSKSCGDNVGWITNRQQLVSNTEKLVASVETTALLIPRNTYNRIERVVTTVVVVECCSLRVAIKLYVVSHVLPALLRRPSTRSGNE